jgi:fumarate hydratase class II
MPHFGPQTKKAIENFPVSGWPVSSHVIHAIALIKEHAALTNGELGSVDRYKAKKIAIAASKIQKGKMSGEFPVDVFQTGSGTSTHMNVNEVIASLAGRDVHPNDDVNCGQSTNDVFPSAIAIACALRLRDGLIPVLRNFQKELTKKSKQFNAITKTGRTHLQDAVPMKLGDEFTGYAALIDHALSQLTSAQKDLCVIPLGGTAVGTGLNAHPKLATKTITRLKKATKLPLKKSNNHFAAQSCPVTFLALSSALCETAVVLSKIANDIRMMGSTQYGELSLPELQPGSSIMPGKVNPVLCESVMQVSQYCLGADTSVRLALSNSSHFELNTSLPLLSQSLLVPINLLTNVTNAFSAKCVSKIKANKKTIEEHTAKNPILVTALAPRIGYDKAAKIAKEAVKTGKPIVEVAAARTKIDKATLKKLLDPSKMA